MTHQDGLIDVHAHFTTERYITEATAAGHLEPDGMPEDYWPYWSASRHLDLMDQAGIDRAILSMSSPGVHFGDDAAARVLAREVNEAGAWISQQHPDRFGQFAALPLPDADGALVEIAYALDDLGADGVILLSNSGGRYLGDSHLSPVLGELDQRRAVIFLHPTSCVGHEHVSCGRPRPMIEFLFDTARTVVDFILSGAAERFPNLQLIVPHAGGVLPLLADRVELFRTLGGDTDDQKPVTALLGKFYYDLAGTPSAAQLAALHSIASTDRLLYGSDYAWTRETQVLQAIERLDSGFPADGPMWRHVTTHNAQQLLHRRQGY
jgi:predicted TIM-barrel fold metal-dependent hydrolase